MLSDSNFDEGPIVLSCGTGQVGAARRKTGATGVLFVLCKMDFGPEWCAFGLGSLPLVWTQEVLVWANSFWSGLEVFVWARALLVWAIAVLVWSGVFLVWAA